MPPRIRSHLVRLAFLAALAAGACSPGSRQFVSTSSSTDTAPGTTSVSSSSSFTNVSERRELKCEVQPGAHTNEIVASFSLRKGSATLRAIGPDGGTVTERTLTEASSAKEMLPLEARAGTWRLEIDLHDTSGSYEVDWNAHP